MFTFPMEVKSVITSPSGGQTMQGPGLYQISGLAWSGFGKIRRVDVSADGGKTWAQAALIEPVLLESARRVSVCRGAGAVRPSVLMSRARRRHRRRAADARRVDRRARHERIAITTTRIQSWKVSEAGEIEQCLR